MCSYLVGSGLGLIYANLLSNYVQTIGSQESSRGMYVDISVLIQYIIYILKNDYYYICTL